MRCLNATDCYFFQECESDPRGAICKGHCELSAWFIQCVIWAVIASLCLLVACFRCPICPLHRCLVRRGNIQGNDTKMPVGGVSRAPSECNKRNFPTFEDVVLVRSLSEHNK